MSGPNISSDITFESVRTSVSTVGAMNLSASSVSPPQKTWSFESSSRPCTVCLLENRYREMDARTYLESLPVTVRNNAREVFTLLNILAIEGLDLLLDCVEKAIVMLNRQSQ